MSFKITSVPIDPETRKRELVQGAAGACVTFEICGPWFCALPLSFGRPGVGLRK